MARHSHWAQIKLKKGALDKKRGKIFTKHAHLIEVAARRAGGDPNMNASLRLAIDNARADNMPRENIDRAIKKGTGELGGGQSEEITYEGYGPGGVALMIDTLTDNKNRTSQTLRTTLQKNGGSLGEAGSTSFLFEKKGAIQVAAKGLRDNDELEIIDAGAEDLEAGESGFLVYTAPSQLAEVRKKLEAKGFKVESAEMTWRPKSTMEISDEATAKKILNLMDLLDEDTDVSNVSANFELPESLMNSVNAVF